MGKRILILRGSPRKGGNSERMADAFSEAAREAGHEVADFCVREHRISGCLACDQCWKQDGRPCVQQDDMQALYPELNLADVVVFATPLYYFGFPAQIKAVIDRFYPFSDDDKAEAFAGKQSLLIACGADEEEDAFDALLGDYERIADYNGWEDRGVVLATGLQELGAVEGTCWLDEARRLAAEL